MNVRTANTWCFICNLGMASRVTKPLNALDEVMHHQHGFLPLTN